MLPKVSDRTDVALPVGFVDAKGAFQNTAQVRPVTGRDEYLVGLSQAYTLEPTDRVYKVLMLARCVTRLGKTSPVSLEDLERLDPRDVRALEDAISELTYAGEPPPPPGRPVRPPAPAPAPDAASAPAASPPSGGPATPPAPRPQRPGGTTTTTSVPPAAPPAASAVPAPPPSKRSAPPPGGPPRAPARRRGSSVGQVMPVKKKD